MTTLANLEETPARQPLFLYGTISCGADTWNSALGKGRQVFSMDSRLRSEDPTHRTNYHRNNWSKYPNLDLLIVKNSQANKASQHWVTEWGQPSRAKNMLVFHGLEVLTLNQGKWFKAWCKNINGKGYEIQSWHIQATDCGASIRSTYLVTFCFSQKLDYPPPLQLPTSKATRPCHNLIRTYGILRSLYHPTTSMKASTSPTHNNIVGKLYGQPVYDWMGPFSSGEPHSWILIPELGIRKVQMDELSKMKGLVDSRYTNMTYQILLNSVEQHVWACISDIISPFILSPFEAPKGEETDPVVEPTPTPPPSQSTQWTWTP